jgi:iron complex transport system substrate-binding protein
LEAFIKIQPSLVVHSGFDPSVPAIQKLNNAGVPLFVNYDWRETHPLGRLEWLKVWGVLFDIQELANKKYQAIRDAYLTLKANFENANKPSVLVGTIYGDVFNAPAGQSYMAQLVKDAGGDYVYSNTKGTGSLTIDMEELIIQNRNTSIWLNAAALNLTDLRRMNQRFELISSVAAKEVYSYFHQVNCFWEESIVKPHIILADLRVIFDKKTENQDLVYYLRLP